MKPFPSYIFARLSAIAAGVALVGALGACTTTSRVTEVHPLPPSATPSESSELRIAETALESGNVDLATNIYDHLVAANPKSVDGLTGLGNALYTVGDFTRAGVYFQRASDADPTAAGPLVGLGRVAIHQRRFNDAITIYRHVLSVSPGDPLAYAGLGAALDLSGDHAGAQAELREALGTHPGDPILSTNLGLSLILGGNPREGANVLLDVARFPSAPPQARQNLALAYGLLGNNEAAAEILGHDLPKASVQDNLHYYDIQRARLSSEQGTARTTLPATVVPPSASAQAVAAQVAALPAVPVTRTKPDNSPATTVAPLATR